MKNKKWKREAKRIKGKVNNELGCFSCNLYGTECYSACLYSLRELELKIKHSNRNKTVKTKESTKYDVMVYTKKPIEDNSDNKEEATDIIFNDYLTEDELNDMIAIIESKSKKNKYTEVSYTENTCTIYIEE